MQLTEVLRRIDDRRDNLPPSERRVADLFGKNPGLFYKASLFDIAVSASVSEGSISRFCKAIGFNGLRELRDVLASIGPDA